MPLSNCVNLLGRGTKVIGGTTPGVGNFSGPASSTLNALVRFADTTGKLGKDSNVTLADSGTSLVFSGAAGLTASGSNNNVTLTPSGTGFGLLQGAAANDAIFKVNAVAGQTPKYVWQKSGADQWVVHNPNGTNNLTFDSGGSGTVAVLSSTGALTIAGKMSSYNGISTAGWGVPAVQSAGRVTAQVAANASVATYTVGAADGTFVVSANVLITTSTTYAFTVTTAYTDEGNTSRTLTMTFSNVGGTLVTSIANAGGAVPYEGVPLHIRAKASTAITVATAAGGVYTSVAYNAEGTIRQLA